MYSWLYRINPIRSQPRSWLVKHRHGFLIFGTSASRRHIQHLFTTPCHENTCHGKVCNFWLMFLHRLVRSLVGTDVRHGWKQAFHGTRSVPRPPVQRESGRLLLRNCYVGDLGAPQAVRRNGRCGSLSRGHRGWTATALGPEVANESQPTTPIMLASGSRLSTYHPGNAGVATANHRK